MNTCDSCKWWFKDFLTRDGLINPCECPKLKNEYGLHNEDGAFNWMPKHILPHNRFYTGPKFGCIHHEPK